MISNRGGTPPSTFRFFKVRIFNFFDFAKFSTKIIRENHDFLEGSRMTQNKRFRSRKLS